MTSYTQEEIEELFSCSEFLLKNVLCFCREETKEETEDIIIIEEALETILIDQRKIKNILLEK